MAWKIIRTEEAYQAALSRLEEIFDCKKGDSHFDEAELLVMLIPKYEQENELVSSAPVSASFKLIFY
jgi:HTH-type transcriptional regulator / antitoxin HigA